MKDLRAAIATLEADPSPTVQRADILSALRAIEEEITALRVTAFAISRKAMLPGPELDVALSEFNGNDYKRKRGVSASVQSKVKETLAGLDSPIESTD